MDSYLAPPAVAFTFLGIHGTATAHDYPKQQEELASNRVLALERGFVNAGLFDPGGVAGPIFYKRHLRDLSFYFLVVEARILL